MSGGNGRNGNGRNGARRARPQKPHATPGEWEEPFLAEYSRLGRITAAAARAGVAVRTVHKKKEHDPEFAEQCERAKAKAVAFYIGKLQQLADENNVTAVIFALKKLDPEVFSDYAAPQSDDDKVPDVRYV